MHMLKAIRGTDLWKRLMKEGRVVEVDQLYGSTMGVDPQHSTNVIPKGMTRVELLSGYMDLVERVFAWENFEARIKGFVANIQRQPKVRMADMTLPKMLRSGLHRMEGQAGQAIESVLSYTEQHAPFMMLSVAILAVRQYQEVLRMPFLRHCLNTQIEMEEKLDLAQVAQQAIA